MKYIYIIVLVLALISCEKVIDIKTSYNDPRLVIDASIDWEKGTVGNDQQIKLSNTTDYFGGTIEPVNGAVVTVSDSNDNPFDFVEDGETGLYECNYFVPEIGMSYTMRIEYNTQVYEAESTMLPTPDILEEIKQNDEGGFEQDLIEIILSYNDPEDEENFYLFDYYVERNPLKLFSSSSDNNRNGELIEEKISLYFDDESIEKISAGDKYIVNFYNISKRYYNFMRLVSNQTEGNNGGPGSTTPVSIKGNCKNITNPDNYPLGYFRTTEKVNIKYLIK
ncbi:MAG: DUF4249 domain-containing protein [Flavobacteriaceae bacterium]|nr:DUF4249 domain-containing protein [Flavobacteriaceae bacterium]